MSADVEGGRLARAPAAEFSHRTFSLVRRLARDFLRPHAGRMALALAALGIMAGATAGNAWLMEPMLDRVFVRHDELLLWVIPVAVIVLARRDSNLWPKE